MSMTAAQCRAARGLLNISQTDLAGLSGVSLRTITSFEAERRQMISANLNAVQTALERAGIEFIGDTGVQLKSSPAADDA